MQTTASRHGDFFRLRPEARLAAWVALGMAGLVVADQLHYWRTMDDFSFGYLVPLFVAFVLNDRWPMLKGIWLGGDDGAGVSIAQERNSPSGACNFFASLVVWGSLLLFLYGGFMRAVTGPDMDSAASLGLGLGGFVLAMGFLISRTDARGRAVTLSRRGMVVALLIFPALVWLLSAPMMLMFETRVKPVLLEWVVRIITNVFDALGFEVTREGSTMLLPPVVPGVENRVGVADACSGIRSLTACLFAGSFLAAVFLDRFWKKIMLLAMSAVLAFGMNIVRSMFLTGWAYSHGSDALDADFWGNHAEIIDKATGNASPNPAFHMITVHDFAGYLVLGLTLVGLLLLLPILNYKIKLPEEAAAKAKEDEHEAASNIGDGAG